MRPASFVILLLFPVLQACSQGASKKNEKQNITAGGPCEGCEAIHESPVPFDQLDWVDTLPDFHEPGPKLEISGIVYKKDGKTAAAGVIIYIYHTDQEGNYSTKGKTTGWGKRHGYIRGWIKTNERGEYKFYTLRPASYPNSNNPQHIHPTVKEPGINEYWIDEFLFEDDPNLTGEHRKHLKGRGGNGILQTKWINGMQVARRDIILGKNIPGYPD